MALAVSLEHLGEKYNNPKAKVLSQTLDKATATLLLEDKSPSKNVKELDNRGSHFYLALFWAQELANCNDSEISAAFKGLAAELEANKDIILKELIDVQGVAVNIGGYYYPNKDLATKSLRPSETFNKAIEGLLVNA